MKRVTANYSGLLKCWNPSFKMNTQRIMYVGLLYRPNDRKPILRKHAK